MIQLGWKTLQGDPDLWLIVLVLNLDLCLLQAELLQPLYILAEIITTLVPDPIPKTNGYFRSDQGEEFAPRSTQSFAMAFGSSDVSVSLSSLPTSFRQQLSGI